MEESVGITNTAQDNGPERTAHGARLRALLLAETAPNKRRQIGGLLLIVAALGALTGLLVANLTAAAIAWCVAFLLLSGTVIAWLYGQSALPALAQFRIGNLKPLNLSETLAIAVIGFVGLMVGLFCLSARSDHAVKITHRQIVDIIFVSNADAEDHHDPLPGTKPKETQKKLSTNSNTTHRGRSLAATPTPRTPAVAAAPVAIAPPAHVTRQAPSAPAARSAPKVVPPSHPFISQTANTPPPIFVTQQQAVVFNNTGNHFGGGSGWTTTNVSAPRIVRHKVQPRDTANLEEVAPAEMLEVTDSQGDSHSQEAWQQGGHSAGGNGAAAQIADYLKELHKRIKRAWTPPRGETRTAEILFRIKHTGQLASLKLLRTSGNSDSDEAALSAIASCAPFKPLPSDFKAGYLDLQYTFNYSVDQLSEAPGHSVE